MTIASITDAICQTPACNKLGSSQKERAQKLLSSQYPYDCCDETLAICLKEKKVCSLVYRLAAELFNNQGFKDKDNGMSLAVSEALRRILAKKKTSVKPQKSSKEKQLETKVKKLKRKTSSPGGSKSIKSDPAPKSSRPKSAADKVNDAISERKKQNAWKHI